MLIGFFSNLHDCIKHVSTQNNVMYVLRMTLVTSKEVVRCLSCFVVIQHWESTLEQLKTEPKNYHCHLHQDRQSKSLLSCAFGKLLLLFIEKIQVTALSASSSSAVIMLSFEQKGKARHAVSLVYKPADRLFIQTIVKKKAVGILIRGKKFQGKKSQLRVNICV